MLRPALFALVLGCSAAAAQTQRVIFPSPQYVGFGGPSVALTRVAGKGATTFGFSGGLIINSHYLLAGRGFGWTTHDVQGRTGGRYDLDVDYGGLQVGYLRTLFEPYHAIAEVTVGSGSVGQRLLPSATRSRTVFVVTEPGLGLEIDLTRSIRLELAGAYRFASGVSLPAFNNADIAGPSAQLTLKFGNFHRPPRPPGKPPIV